MKDTKRKAHELAAIVESVAGILFDTPEPEPEPEPERKRRSDFYPGADEDGMVGPEQETERKTAQWKPLVIEQGAPPLRWYCSACDCRANIFTRGGDLVDADPSLSGWRFCPLCGAEMISEAG